MERNKIESDRTNLELLFPLENKVITKDEYNKAREYYGKLWFYVGD